MHLLTEIHEGSRVRFLEYSKDFSLKKRLASMGFHLGSEVFVVKNDSSSPVIIAIGETKLMLGRTLANMIKVELVSKGSIAS